MRLLLAAALLMVAAPDPSNTSLRVTVWPEGTLKTERPRSWTLRCGPVGGTLPRSGSACRALDSLTRPFTPVPRQALCGAIYGGPAVALVRGSHRGRRIWTRFRRDNGCQIARWDRVKFLFPVRIDTGG